MVGAGARPAASRRRLNLAYLPIGPELPDEVHRRILAVLSGPAHPRDE